MKKLKLDIEDLKVDSFTADADRSAEGGTVAGQNDEEPKLAVTAPWCSLPLCLPTGLCQSINYCPTWDVLCGTDGGPDCIA
jgi:hypothetical protein